MADPQWIFGLSIEKKVHWATALSDPEGNLSNISKVGTFEDIHVTGPVRPSFNLQEELATALRGLDFDIRDCAAIGVSTYGVVDRQKKVLSSICLANLLPQKGASLVDFRALFSRTLGIRSVRRNGNRLSVQNDATAIALAEYLAQSERNVKGPLLYLRFDEGVNGGIIIGKEPLKSQFNVEIGHVCPPLHGRDRDFRGVCPVHGACYEGLASKARLRRSWPDQASSPDKTLYDFPAGHEAWRIIAYYIARLCLNGVLFLAPARIILGGDIVCGLDSDSRSEVYQQLFPLVWAEFDRLNGSYPSDFEPTEKIIERGRITADASVAGALRVAAAALGDPETPVETMRQRRFPVIPGGRGN
jgi:predicted NBD/HSP70 family sugar kinase